MINRSQPHATDGWTTSRVNPSDGGPVARQLMAIVDASLCGIIFVAPYFLGGRHDLGRLALLLFIALAAGAWFLRQAILPSARQVRTAAHVVILLAIALVVLQLTPLPSSWIAQLSPRTVKLLPLWNDSAEAHMGTWHTLSLTPHETTKSLALLVGYGLLFVVVAQRIKDTADVRRLLQWFAIAVTAMAVFGLVQYLTSNGHYFWFYEHPHRTPDQVVVGSFMNQNHCAAFLVLGIGPLAGWLVLAMRASTRKGARRSPLTIRTDATALLLAGSLTIVVLAILLSLSRGGAISLVVATAVNVALYWRRHLIGSKYFYGGAALFVMVVVLLSICGYDRVVARLDDFVEGSIDVMDPAEGRRLIWRANLAAIEDGWLTGAGAGSHREIYPVYLQRPLAKEYTHAENGYLQVITETGLAGGMLLLVSIGMCGYWCAACYRRATGESELIWCGAVAGGLAASAVHSVVDFIWYIPACMSLTVILAACALRLSQLSLSPAHGRQVRRVVGRPISAAVAIAVVLAAGWTVITFAGPAIADVHWHRYLRTANADATVSRKLLSELDAGHDAATWQLQGPLSDTMVYELEQTVHWEPQSAHAHARLADRYMVQFELRLRNAQNTMDITQIRDAAVASSFASPRDLRLWLHRAFGADAQMLYRAQEHARRAIELCPLRGDGYLYLADLCFLDGATYAAAEAYADQGLRVRPQDKGVLYRAGVQALSSGQLDETLRHWSQCYNVRGNHQPKIIYRLVASGMPASLFVSTFQPDWQTLLEVRNRYRQFGTVQDLQDLLRYAADITQRDAPKAANEQAGYMWLWQSSLHHDVGETEEALACLEQAYARSPREFKIRLRLGQALMSADRYAEAEPHIRWCRGRRPENQALSAALVEIAKHRLEEERQDGSEARRGIGGWRR